MIEREIVVNLGELIAELQCPDCHAGILLDLSKGQNIQATACPVCTRDTQKEHDLMSKFYAFVQEAEKSKATVKFRIKE
jgi:Zn ribbon nucleic-acid-binding protein